jgi:hypothetical protein
VPGNHARCAIIDGNREESGMMSDARVGRLGELVRSERFTRTALADGTGVVLDAEGMRLISLNQTAMCLLEALASGADLDTLVERLVRDFEVSGPTAREDVERFLGELMGFVSSP